MEDIDDLQCNFMKDRYYFYIIIALGSTAVILLIVYQKLIQINLKHGQSKLDSY